MCSADEVVGSVLPAGRGELVHCQSAQMTVVGPVCSLLKSRAAVQLTLLTLGVYDQLVCTQCDAVRLPGTLADEQPRLPHSTLGVRLAAHFKLYSKPLPRPIPDPCPATAVAAPASALPYARHDVMIMHAPGTQRSDAKCSSTSARLGGSKNTVPGLVRSMC